MINSGIRRNSQFSQASLVLVVAMIAASFCSRRGVAAYTAQRIATRRVAFARRTVATHAARLQDDGDEWSPPKSRPPPRARPMPPTLESFESSNAFLSDYDDSASDFGAYDYDPFNNVMDGNSNDMPTYSLTGATASVNHDDNDDVPNPHAYQEADSNDKKPVNQETSEKVQSVDEADVPNPHAYQEEASSLQNERNNPPVNNKKTAPQFPAKRPPPKAASMPPRAAFPSAPSDNDDRREVYVKASSGNAITSPVDMLTEQLERLEQDIYAQNNHKEFNIKSTKQVSQVLFGRPGQSTNKQTLEAMGGSGKVMADLILQHRSLSRQISRLKRKEEESSTRVRDVSKKTSSRSKNASQKDNDPLLLVDASAYIFRAYFSMPPIHRADGMPVGAVLGFCNMLNRLVLNRMLEGEQPRLVLVFDAQGKNFRHDLYEEYKAHRPECPMDLVPQFDLIREAAVAYGIHQLEAPNFEADDVIATLATMARKEGVNSSILSGDKDLMQLITPEDDGPCIDMIDPMSMSRVSHDEVVSKWGVTPDQLGDVLALAGDSADNVPGVPGIGPKIAASLIGEYGSLDLLLEKLDSVKQKARRQKLQDNADQARLSRELVDLERAIPVDKMTFPENLTSVSELRMEVMDGERLLNFYDSMGLKDIKRRVEARMKQKKTSRKRKSARRPKAEIPTPDDYQDVPF